MNLSSLIGKTFQENQLYELLLFDIEENFAQYSSKHIHFYFDRIKNDKIKVTQIVYFRSSVEIDLKDRTIIGKQEWFEVTQNDDHFNLLLCRFDRTGFASSIWKESTHTQDWCLGWADEGPDLGPMTPKEIRQAALELGGFFEDQQELQKLKSKKAV